MGALDLSQKLIKHFKITDFSEPKSGGQKTVYIVKIDGKDYALKIIKVEDERFEREVKICEEFKDVEGIPKIVKIEKFEGDTIILEEYIEGEDLKDVLINYKDDEGKITKLIIDIAEILRPVWAANYVHRDLKLENIRISPDGKPFVLDFGIARALDEATITAGAMQPHSWPFASPEQHDGKKELITYRTDFFSLGGIASFLYTGKLPFGTTKDQVAQNLLSGKEVEFNTGNEKLDKFCSSACRIKVSARPRTVDLFLKEIL